ncbi:phage baseplate assembly protein V [Paenibacillus sp. Aloe-11]|uniref:phage baseplate assembly protein V n=1 Tax=Paenibacillus sp. Aloe-11 TaxID=1050222 RepID=UPI00024F0051|nr:phage baseplate assembly protein V [Paenibacillus sp. Aloe-11]EHS56360.1 hypothetical protein WG8_3573 [Paenibacillus sp. Aloe-11]
MSTPILAYDNVKISPFEQVKLKELKIIHQVNEHGKLSFTGTITEEQKDKYVHSIQAQTPVEVYQVLEGGGRKELFCGLISMMEIQKVLDVYYLKAEAHTYSYLLDMQIKTRSYQNASLNYSRLIKEVGGGYDDFDVIYSADRDESIGNFVLQYHETDWTFLKRMAARVNTVLMPVGKFKSIKTFFGIPDDEATERLENFNYTVKKNLSEYLVHSKNHQTDVHETDFVYYEIETHKILNLGDAIRFQDRPYFIQKSISTMEKGLIVHRYTLASRLGINRAKPYNERIRGASIGGRVLAIKRDTVKVHLEIDNHQDEGTAYWFPYSTVYASEDGSGWYCMPEKGDSVRVNLPSQWEDAAFAISSVNSYSEDSAQHGSISGGGGSASGGSGNSSGDRMSDPNVRYFRNPAGMEVKLTPEHVEISANGGQALVKLEASGTVTIIGQKEVSLHSKENVKIRAEKTLMMTATDEIVIGSDKGGKITLDQAGNAKLAGTEVFTN